MAELFVNSGDPDQMPRSSASDLGLHCLPITLLEIFRLQWVKYSKTVAHLAMVLKSLNISLP